MTVPNDKLIEMYRRMLLTRRNEEMLQYLLNQGTSPTPFHFSMGQEAVSIGATAALRADDWFHPTHRGLGDHIGKGMSPRELWAELYGKTTGCCKGRGGMVMANMKVGVVPMPGGLGINFGVAVGQAFGFKLQGIDRVVMMLFGEGTVNQTDCGASMNMASLWKVPMIYACVNNQYTELAPYRVTTCTEHVAPRAAGYDMAWAIVEDANDVEAVYEATLQAVERARSGGGPTFMEYKTYRIASHYSGDPAAYQPKEEIAAWKIKDPIKRCLATLLERGALTQERADEMDRQCRAEVEDALQFGQTSPSPTAEDIGQYVWA